MGAVLELVWLSRKAAYYRNTSFIALLPKDELEFVKVAFCYLRLVLKGQFTPTQKYILFSLLCFLLHCLGLAASVSEIWYQRTQSYCCLDSAVVQWLLIEVELH